MSQVHSFLLGYLSGQLGLLKVPVGLWILCSHSATGSERESERKNIRERRYNKEKLRNVMNHVNTHKRKSKQDL